MPTNIVRHLTLAVALAAAPFAGAQSAPPPASPPAAADPFIVHEWGTFTSLQGSDGVGLEGLQHEEERLPSFVYSRTKVRDCPLRSHGYKGLEVPVEHVTQKMETPVIYFHSATPRKARVRVDFIGGLITQWYPVSNLIGPPEGMPQDGPLDLATVKRSFLEWDIDLIPGDTLTPPPPTAPNDDPWQFARAVKSAGVRTAPRSGADRMGPVESERFLFYRGLGTFSLPVRVSAAKGGQAQFQNAGKFPIPAVFALHIGEDAGGFENLGAVPAGESRTFDVTKAKLGPTTGIVEGLKIAVKRTLIDQGLEGDEAEAMVNTWSRQWFATRGSRFIYLVPRPVVDDLLPLDIQPKPDRLVRILVGRLEYLTPEVEAQLEKDLLDRLSEDMNVAKAAMARLYSLDRFLEPHLRRVLTTSSNDRARESAKLLLGEIITKNK